MGKNSRHWRWLYRNVDLSRRVVGRLEAAGYPSRVTCCCEIIQPRRITATKIFEVTTQAPYDLIRQAVGELGTGMTRTTDGTYEVWYG